MIREWIWFVVSWFSCQCLPSRHGVLIDLCVFVPYELAAKIQNIFNIPNIFFTFFQLFLSFYHYHLFFNNLQLHKFYTIFLFSIKIILQNTIIIAIFPNFYTISLLTFYTICVYCYISTLYTKYLIILFLFLWATCMNITLLLTR